MEQIEAPIVLTIWLLESDKNVMRSWVRIPGVLGSLLLYIFSSFSLTVECTLSGPSRRCISTSLLKATKKCEKRVLSFSEKSSHVKNVC